MPFAPYYMADTRVCPYTRYSPFATRSYATSPFVTRRKTSSKSIVVSVKVAMR
jgi:hypothetical protein